MRALTAFVVAHVLAGLVALAPRPAAGPRTQAFPGWPAALDGRRLEPLPLTEAEERAAREFPGRIGRFTDGSAEILLRWVDVPTRALHPAGDCVRAAGWSVTPEPLVRDRAGRAWGRVTARRGTQAMVVSERVHDAAGNSYADVSSWYWAALLSRTRGPWWAITIAVRS